MVYFAKNCGQKPGESPLKSPLFHSSLPSYGYQITINGDFCRITGSFL